MKRRGLRIAPCNTPTVTSILLDELFATFTRRAAVLYKFLNILMILALILSSKSEFPNKSWFTLSKALLKSTKIQTTFRFGSLICEWITDCKLNTLSSQPFPLRNPACASGKIFKLDSTQYSSLLAIICVRTLTTQFTKAMPR